MKWIIFGVALCLLAAGVLQVLIWQNNRRERQHAEKAERLREQEADREAYERG